MIRYYGIWICGFGSYGLVAEETKIRAKMWGLKLCGSGSVGVLGLGVLTSGA